MLQLTHTSSHKKPIWLVNSSYGMGSGSEQDIRVADVANHCAYILVDGDIARLVVEQENTLKLNGKFVHSMHKLRHGDKIGLGTEEFTLLEPKRDKSILDVKLDLDNTSVFPETRSNITAMLERMGGSERIVLQGEMQIGRSSDCDIILHGENLSRHHAQIKTNNGKVIVEDEHSSYGTYINDEKISCAELHHADKIQFADAIFTLHKTTHADVDIDKTSVRQIPSIHHEPRSVETPHAICQHNDKRHKVTGKSRRSAHMKPSSSEKRVQISKKVLIQPSQKIEAKRQFEHRSGSKVLWLVFFFLIIAITVWKAFSFFKLV